MTTIEVTPEVATVLSAFFAQFVEAPTTEVAPKTRKAAKKAAKKATASKATTEAPNAFVTWLGETAEARKARQADNKVLAASLREAGLNPNGAVWKAAKAGEADLTVLRQIAADNGEVPVKKVAKKATASKAKASTATKAPAKADRSAAAKKGAETRRVNALRKTEQYATLIAAEFSDEQAIAALSV
jgi:hypothetical protein